MSNTFVRGVSRIMDQEPRHFRDIMTEYVSAEDLEGLMELRKELVEEYVAAAMRYDDAEYRIRRIRGEQWKLEMRIGREPDRNSQIIELYMFFWAGGEFLLDKETDVV